MKVIPVLQMKEWGPREGKRFVQSHTSEESEMFPSSAGLCIFLQELGGGQSSKQQLSVELQQVSFSLGGLSSS